MKIHRIYYVIMLLTIVVACEKNEEDLAITSNQIVGKWLISERSIGFTTDCERNEYLEFYSNGELFRSQCGTSTGTWRIEEEQLLIDLALDTIYTDSEYECEMLTADKIKIKAVKNVFLWATYTKVEE